MKLKIFLIAITFYFTMVDTGMAQTDSVNTVTQTTPLKAKKKWYKTNAFKAFIVPAVLIGYGASTIQNHGFYSSYDAKKDVHNAFPNFQRTHIDDYLIYAPYVELLALNLLKIKCKNDFLNTSLLIIKTELIMTAIVFPVKYITHIQRPDSSDYHSFPSGHTAAAFAAASIVHREYKDKSIWYGVGAYTLAASVGAFRMLNNKHWESDVFAGAGVGILSAHIAYLTHRNRWGRQCTSWTMVPFRQNGATGVVFSMKI
jgi:membrane-associated phospholipid phosphatase